MVKKRIFISSVQNEFSKEREELCNYLRSDPLLGKFFEPFIFEELPASNQSVQQAYLREVANSHLYLGLLGKEYGFETEEGVSPTELEFDQATKHHLTRLIFLTTHNESQRHPKEVAFVAKVQSEVVRKIFTHIDDLKTSVYSSLIRYLEENGIIRTTPFDATFHSEATIEDIDKEKVREFIQRARSRRGFPLSESDSTEKVLTHLNLMNHAHISQAALLLFGKEPQKFFITSEVRCASFHGTIVEKPIPSYKVFRGSLFELVDKTVDFILSKLDYSIGTRSEQIQIPGAYEIPKDVIAEAVVNAIAHRDYTSYGSVQVMIFRDRVEIWNPGSIPFGWTTEMLKKIHPSIPANPLIAEPMYLAGYIERLGTGTADIVQKALDAELQEPQFIQETIFRVVLFRKVTEQVTEQVKRLLMVLESTNEVSRQVLMEKLKLKHRPTFLYSYLKPALEAGYVQMTTPKAKHNQNQTYALTTLGSHLLKTLKEDST